MVAVNCFREDCWLTYNSAKGVHVFQEKHVNCVDIFKYTLCLRDLSLIPRVLGKKKVSNVACPTLRSTHMTDVTMVNRSGHCSPIIEVIFGKIVLNLGM